jgi:hypothetical protein
MGQSRIGSWKYSNPSPITADQEQVRNSSSIMGQSRMGSWKYSNPLPITVDQEQDHGYITVPRRSRLVKNTILEIQQYPADHGGISDWIMEIWQSLADHGVYLNAVAL